MLLEKPARPLDTVHAAADYLTKSKKFDAPKYLSEHIYMFGGKSITAKLRCDKRAFMHIIVNIIDWFGESVRFSDECENFVTATVTANENALRHWALRYGTTVEVLAPKTQRTKVRKDIKKTWEKYKKEFL
jgi:hypothetical protein